MSSVEYRSTAGGGNVFMKIWPVIRRLFGIGYFYSFGFIKKFLKDVFSQIKGSS